MTQMIPTAKKLLVGAVATGAMALGTAGVAGAVSTTTVPKVVKHFNCARAPKVLSRIQKGEAKIAAGLPRLTAAEAKATKNGNAQRAARIKRRIDRLESPAFKARLDKAKATIEAKCHVNAPAAGSPSATTPTTSSGSAGTASTSA
jgi:hypothetical protein